MTRSIVPPNTAPIVTASFLPTNVMVGWMTDMSAIVAVLPGTINGQTGENVTLTTDDISDEGQLNRYVTTAEKALLSGLDEALAGKADADHTHIIADVTGLQDALDGKAAVDHTHVEADITDLDKYTRAEVDALLGAVLVLDCGDSTGPAVNHGYRLDGGLSDTEFNPMIGSAGLGDATGVT